MVYKYVFKYFFELEFEQNEYTFWASYVSFIYDYNLNVFIQIKFKIIHKKYSSI